ncbi:hypothetical protein SEA_KELCOLE_8 [Microbacterium phage Kelcole]|nr:hypothetical protein SEA_KELCOLE_8 [Microbacterium phage Kelcole]
MKLIREEPHLRWYEGDDGTVHEVRPEIHGQLSRSGLIVLDPTWAELKETHERLLLDVLRRWFRWHPQLVAIGVPTEPEWTREWTRWEPGMVDPDGVLIEEFEPFEMAVCFVEQAYWPPAPKEIPNER